MSADRKEKTLPLINTDDTDQEAGGKGRDAACYVSAVGLVDGLVRNVIVAPESSGADSSDLTNAVTSFGSDNFRSSEQHAVVLAGSQAMQERA